MLNLWCEGVGGSSGTWAQRNRRNLLWPLSWSSVAMRGFSDCGLLPGTSCCCSFVPQGQAWEVDLVLKRTIFSETSLPPTTVIFPGQLLSARVWSRGLVFHWLLCLCYLGKWVWQFQKSEHLPDHITVTLTELLVTIVHLNQEYTFRTLVWPACCSSFERVHSISQRKTPYPKQL